MPLNFRNMRKKLAAKGRAIRGRRRRAPPARFNFSKKRYNSNKALSKKASQMSETKLIACTQFEEKAPKAIQTGAIAYYSSYIMTNVPPGWDGNFNNLGGIATAQGTGGNNRVGDYIYLKKSHVNFQIDINETSGFTAPIEFRMIVAKARTGVLPVGYTYTPSTTLFLNTVGFPIGHATSGVTGTDLMLQPVNKRDWTVFKDMKFTLSSPDTAGGGMNYFYPSRKNVLLNLPYYGKCRVNTSTGLPEDLDTHYIIMIYGSSVGKDRSAADWEVSTRGTTSFTDN